MSAASRRGIIPAVLAVAVLTLTAGCSSQAPESAVSLDRIIRKAFAAYEARDYTATIESSRAVLDLYPYYAPAHFLIGKSEYSQGNIKAAEKALRDGLQYQPCDVEALNFLAGLLYGKGDYESSIAYSKEALELEPRTPGPYGLLAGAYLKLGREQQAKHALDTLKSLDPAHYAKTMAMIQAGEF